MSTWWENDWASGCFFPTSEWIKHMVWWGCRVRESRPKLGAQWSTIKGIKGGRWSPSQESRTAGHILSEKSICDRPRVSAQQGWERYEKHHDKLESGFWSTHGYPASRLVTISVKTTAKFQKYLKFLLFSPVFSASFRLGEGSSKGWTWPSRAASCAQVMWQWPCNFSKPG